MKVLKWSTFDFKPNTLDMRFKIWYRKGITAYCSIMDQIQLLDFQSLKERFIVESKDFFRYLQLRQHFYQKIKKMSDEDPNKIALVQIIPSACNAQPMEKTIIQFYKVLTDFQGDSSFYIKSISEKCYDGPRILGKKMQVKLFPHKILYTISKHALYMRSLY